MDGKRGKKRGLEEDIAAAGGGSDEDLEDGDDDGFGGGRRRKKPKTGSIASRQTMRSVSTRKTGRSMKSSTNHHPPTQNRPQLKAKRRSGKGGSTASSLKSGKSTRSGSSRKSGGGGQKERFNYKRWISYYSLRTLYYFLSSLRN